MPRQKLNDEQVKAIRYAYQVGGVSLRILGRMYHVSATQIWRIIYRRQRA